MVAVALASLAAMVVGCSLLGPRTFELTLPHNEVPLLVRMTDTTGTVDRLELPAGNIPQAVIGKEIVVGLDGRPDALAIGWLGGMCDQAVDIELRAGSAPMLTLREERRMGGCELTGLSRFVIVVFNTPVDARQFRLEVVPVPVP